MVWPLTHTTEKYFLENLPHSYGPYYEKRHLPKLYVWVWFWFTLGYFFFSFLFFSFYDLFISRWSDSSQIFWFFRARSIYRKILNRNKVVVDWPNDKMTHLKMTHSVQKCLFMHFYMFRGSRKGIVRSKIQWSRESWGEPDVFPSSVKSDLKKTFPV